MHYRWAFSAESQSLCMCPLPGSAWESEGGKKEKDSAGQQCVCWWRQVKVRWTVSLLNNARGETASQTATALSTCFLYKFCEMTGWFSPCFPLSLSSIFPFFFFFISLPLTPSALDFMNLLNWCRWGACGTLSYWFAVGFGVVGNTSRSLGWTHEAFYLQSPSTGKSAFSIDFFIMSPWKANASTVWRAPTSPRSTRPLDHICHTLEAILYSSLPW